MPFVICPSCDRVNHGAAAYRVLDLCRFCGEVLPERRSVVPVTAQQGGVRAPSDVPLRRPSDRRLRQATDA